MCTMDGLLPYHKVVSATEETTSTPTTTEDVKMNLLYLVLTRKLEGGKKTLQSVPMSKTILSKSLRKLVAKTSRWLS
jgi:hypothetical protein